MALLEVKKLTTGFNLNKETLIAVDGISFSINLNETIALIGESGSGKSVTALSLMGLIDSPGEIISGQIIWGNENPIDLLTLKEKEWLQVRGNQIAMIHQDPMTSLNSRMTIGKQIDEVFIIHKKMSKKEAKAKTIELLEKLEIPNPVKRYQEYPSHLSGGMRQRIVIAMAIAGNPKLLIADEPTTALDVTIQDEVLTLLNDLQSTYGMAMILTTHDLGVVAEMADQILVMYGGRIMEQASTLTIFKKPLNPYTKALMDCVPKIEDKHAELKVIPGTVPSLGKFPKGCRFANRCEHSFKPCHEHIPELVEVETNHWVRCWLYPDQ